MLHVLKGDDDDVDVDVIIPCAMGGEAFLWQLTGLPFPTTTQDCVVTHLYLLSDAANICTYVPLITYYTPICHTYITHSTPRDYRGV